MDCARWLWEDEYLHYAGTARAVHILQRTVKSGDVGNSAAKCTYDTVYDAKYGSNAINRANDRGGHARYDAEDETE